MSRTFSPHATDAAKALLQRLADRAPVDEYREAMRGLGRELGGIVAGMIGSMPALLICTNEDADFLAQGVLDGMAPTASAALACFWNDRKRFASDLAPTLDVAPIVRRYVEPVERVEAFVVVKSVISSACVVRTNIAELAYVHDPQRILVVSPVMHSGARPGLEADLGPDLARRLEYVWFATDDEKKADGEVVPGIGGSVYELLGIGTAETKNGYSPELVRRRRAMLPAGS
ncbi:MAG: hypothetical protein K2W96_17610 [Gemmataceae bacterium]|nr:hypothetical protein [Gemmataceae bacterium]